MKVNKAQGYCSGCCAVTEEAALTHTRTNMTSLADLRRRFGRLDGEPQNDTGSLSVIRNDTSPENSRNKGDTGTIEITENQTWLNKIEFQGNRAEDWLEYIRYVSQNTDFPNEVKKHNYLCGMYERAFKVIDVVSNKRNEAYAQLFMECAKLKSVFCPEDAIQMMNQARSIVRRFAMVHVMAAEFEYKQGDVTKARKILEKALLFGAEPSSMVEGALERLNEGHGSLQGEPVQSKPNQSESRPPAHPPPRSKEPARIRKINLPFREVEVDLDGDKENNTGLPHDHRTQDTNTVLPHDHRSQDTHTNYALGSISMTHSSGYCSMMDVSIPTETKMSPPQSEIYKTPNPCEEQPKHKSPIKPMQTEDVPIPEAVSVRRPLQVLKGPSKPMDWQSASIPKMNLAQMCCDQDNSNSSQPPEPQEKHNNFPKSFSSSNVSVSTEHSRVPITKSKSVSSSQLPGREPHLKSTVKEPPHSSGVEEPKNNVMARLEEHPQQRSPRSHADSRVPPLPSVPPKGMAMMGPTPVKQNTRQLTNHQMVTPCMKGIPPPAVPSTPSLMMKDITVNGKQYWVLKLVGRGGSSKVYKVLDSNLENRAIKVVDLADANEQILEGYRNEIHLLERLQYCSKVIKMYDYEYDEDNSKLYIVMEHGTVDFAIFIKNRLKEEGLLSPNTIKFYWEDMLQAVGALHKQGIIHSDLKPSNFLVIDGTLRLIDFGIAKSIQCDKTSVMVDTQVGTLNYMSPESIVDSCGGEGGGRSKPTYKLGVKSDIWSLGCILYYMVYGHTPFQKITNTFVKLKAIINPDYPIEFKDISDKNLLDTIQKCLLREPRERASIEDLLAHPYITNLERVDQEAVPKLDCKDDHLERLVKQLSTKFASSPSGIRSMVQSAMMKDST
ncbi:dual specificity protein kinase TTK-like [Ylistrum balloti]|uniref:dual specificity protein kinase TTK-like n=1 Tax=Ylistrum balloti TaxID=509963 RepID=UPI0029059868|nr:dual specificity protein kinase TTK-like [Ylistrum balloti]